MPCEWLGDVDGSGAVSREDADLIAAVSGGSLDRSELACPEAADVGLDGRVDIGDAQTLFNYINGQIDTLPDGSQPPIEGFDESEVELTSDCVLSNEVRLASGESHDVDISVNNRNIQNAEVTVEVFVPDAGVVGRDTGIVTGAQTEPVVVTITAPNQPLAATPEPSIVDVVAV